MAKRGRLVEKAVDAVAAVRIRLRHRIGRPLPDELSQHAFVHANVTAADSYVARPYDGRITVFRATGELFDDPIVAETGLGWSTVAAGGLDVVDVPGNHMSMFEEPNVGSLAAKLAMAITAAHDRAARDLSVS